MENILNITNGGCAVEIMKAADIAGDYLPWDDVLHEGPVPENLSLEALSKVRAQFIIGRNWGTPEQINKAFTERDNKLKSFDQYEKVILWFEHDLYDQLQILQLLDWFNSNPINGVELSIICTENYLGRLTPAEMKGLVNYAEPVTASHLALSSQAWAAFRSSSPEKWYGLLNTDTSRLPFLAGAILRMLEEYPSCANGLSRTAQQALQTIAAGEKHPGKIFALSQALEDRIFLGDSSFWVVLQALLDSSPPLLSLSEGKTLTLPGSSDQALSITSAGRAVLAGQSNWLEITEPDRWIGGVHLRPGNIWCWDSDSGALLKKKPLDHLTAVIVGKMPV